MSLNNLANRLGEAGQRRGGAGRRAEEAVSQYRQLAEASPAAYLPDLATSLNNLASRLGEVGRREEALATAAGSRRVSTGSWPRPARPPTSPTWPCR